MRTKEDFYTGKKSSSNPKFPPSRYTGSWNIKIQYPSLSPTKINNKGTPLSGLVPNNRRVPY